MVKDIQFIEKKNKPLFEVELSMEYIIDDVYKKIIEHYKENNISDIILIDPRLDLWRTKLIGCRLLEDSNIIGKNKYIYAFNKKSFNVNYGFLCRESLNELIIKGKNDFFRICKNQCYIFYNDTKTKKEKENDNMRNLLENLINNKIKIKKVSNN